MSAFFYNCEEKGIQARGIDHISIRFTGTCMCPSMKNVSLFSKGKEFICVSEKSSELVETMGAETFIDSILTLTAIKIRPGGENKGIYITLRTRGNEEYLLTHPSMGGSRRTCA